MAHTSLLYRDLNIASKSVHSFGQERFAISTINITIFSFI